MPISKRLKTTRKNKSAAADLKNPRQPQAPAGFLFRRGTCREAHLSPIACRPAPASLQPARECPFFELLNRQLNRCNCSCCQADRGARRSAPQPIFQATRPRPPAVSWNRWQAATAGGSVKEVPLGLSEVVWSGLAAVRWVVERVVAARCGGHPDPPDNVCSCTCSVAGLILLLKSGTIEPISSCGE
jgi:hypothetical protein